MVVIPARQGVFGEGRLKYRKEDCKICDFYKMLDGIEYCGGGKAFKVLETSFRNSMLVCSLRKKDMLLEERSITYIDSVIDLKIINA